MHHAPSEGSLTNYRQLLDRIDNFCRTITEEFAEEVVCKAGCSGCCRHLSVFAVEAANLLAAIALLSAGQKEILAGRMTWDEASSCPFLMDDLCAVYSARPVICRTHGLPLLIESDGIKKVDCCPENFKGLDSLPGSAVISLETLNSTLYAINRIFLTETDDIRLKSRDRFSFADIIRLSEEIV